MNLQLLDMMFELIWNSKKGELTGIEKAVLIRLAYLAVENKTHVSLTTLTLDTGLKRQIIINAIESLLTKDMLNEVINSTNLKHISSIYTINISALEKSARKPYSGVQIAPPYPDMPVEIQNA